MAYYIRLSYDHKHQWQVPSGAEGKSTNDNTHEHRYGFGFEEWNFNPRRFKDETGSTSAHFGYVQAFNRAMPPDESEDLVLYTLQSNGRKVINRYIIARIKAGSWRFIDHKRYNALRGLNNGGINSINDELALAYHQNTFRAGLSIAEVLNRFMQQVDCRDWNGNTSNTYRLWNIEFLKPIKILKQQVNEDTPCPDGHINNLNRFRLNNSKNFDHKNCK